MGSVLLFFPIGWAAAVTLDLFGDQNSALNLSQVLPRVHFFRQKTQEELRLLKSNPMVFPRSSSNMTVSSSQETYDLFIQKRFQKTSTPPWSFSKALRVKEKTWRSCALNSPSEISRSARAGDVQGGWGGGLMFSRSFDALAPNRLVCFLVGVVFKLFESFGVQYSLLGGS